MRISLDHIHIFSTDIATSVEFFEQMLAATLVWDEEAASVRNVRLKLGNGFIHLYERPPKRHGAVPCTISESRPMILKHSLRE